MKGQIVKRYIYAGLGTLGLAGAGVALAMSLSPASDLATAVVTPPHTVSPSASPSASASPSEPSETPDAIATPAEETKPAEALPAPVPAAIDPDSTAPVSSNDSLVNQKQDPGATSELSASQQMKTRPDGTIYFVDAKTGQEIKEPESVTPGGGTGNTAPRPIDAPGAGSQEDKMNAATSYMNHLNALYNKDWDKACSYIILPAGMTADECATRIEKRTSERPLSSAYSIANVNPVDIQGDKGTVSPLALKNADGDGTRAMPVTRSSADAKIWLIDGASLLDIK